MEKCCDTCRFCTIHEDYDRLHEEYSVFLSCGMLNQDFKEYNVRAFICDEYVTRNSSIIEVLERDNHI